MTNITQLQAARDAAFAAFTAAKKGKSKAALAEAEAALKAASKALTAAKAATDESFVTPERLAETQAKAMAALAAREASQAAERQQQQDIAQWSRHVDWVGENAYMHGQTPARRCPSYLRAVFNRLRYANVVDADGEFSAAFLAAEE